MNFALRAAAETNHFAFDDALRANRLSLAVAGNADDQNAHRLPVEKYRNNVNDQRDQQRDRQRDMDIQPYVDPRFKLAVSAPARRAPAFSAAACRADGWSSPARRPACGR